MIKKAAELLGGGESVVGFYRVLIAAGMGIIIAFWNGNDSATKSGQQTNTVLIRELRADVLADFRSLRETVERMQAIINANSTLLGVQAFQLNQITTWQEGINLEFRRGGQIPLQ